MPAICWNDLAVELARHIRKNGVPMHQGAMFITLAADNMSAAALFGNDNYVGSARSRLAVALIRHRISETGMEEAGFGLSPDGHSWVLLVRPPRFHDCVTVAGRAFQLEMWNSSLRDLLVDACQRAAAALVR